jgi:hypothetical protein
VVRERYPNGGVHLFPAKTAGLTATFPHQLYNEEGPGDRPWREGSLCLETPGATVNRLVPDQQPRTAVARLRWHLHRALAWLKAAEEETLTTADEPFELPAIPRRLKAPSLLAFNESQANWDVWREAEQLVGIVHLYRPMANPKVIVTNRFTDLKGAEIVSHLWGYWVKESKSEKAIWIRLGFVPVCRPWHIPGNWGDLQRILTEHGRNWDHLLKDALECIRDQGRGLLLIGFPISERNDGGGRRGMHWFACEMSPLSRGKPHGFRPNKQGYWQRDKSQLFAQSRSIPWMESANWTQEQLSSRGQLPEAVRNRKWLLIGCGALGSAVAEMLVRGGVLDLSVADREVLAGGNLVRHTLEVSDVEVEKASALARRLNRANPHAKVECLTAIPPEEVEKQEVMLRADIIVDCTADDNLLRDLSAFPWDQPRRFLSLSLGREAKRLFCFAADAPAFPLEAFDQLIGPHMELEQKEADNVASFPREGIGCWHPIFPARIDDIWLHAATAIKFLEQIASTSTAIQPALQVFLQQVDTEGFVEVRRA